MAGPHKIMFGTDHLGPYHDEAVSFVKASLTELDEESREFILGRTASGRVRTTDCVGGTYVFGLAITSQRRIRPLLSARGDLTGSTEASEEAGAVAEAGEAEHATASWRRRVRARDALQRLPARRSSRPTCSWRGVALRRNWRPPCASRSRPAGAGVRDAGTLLDGAQPDVLALEHGAQRAGALAARGAAARGCTSWPTSRW